MSKHIKIQPLESVFAYLCLSMIFFVLHLIFTSIVSAEAYVEFLKYAVVGLLLLNVFVSTKIYGLKIYHPYLLLLGTLTFFILSRIILDLIYKDVNFAQTNFLSYYVFSVEIQSVLLQNIIISLIALQIGAGLAVGRLIVNVSTPNELLEDINWRTMGLFLFYLGLPFLAYQYIQVAKEVLAKGYLIIHDGKLEYSNSLITVFFSRLSWVGFFIFLASIPPKKLLYPNLVLFILVLIPRLLQGARGPVMCMALVLFWYVLYITNKDVKMRNLVMLLVAMFFLNIYVGSFRVGEDYQQRSHLAKRFFYEQGVSVQVLGYSVEHDKAMSEYGLPNMFSRLRTFVDVAKRKVTGEPGEMSKDEIVREFGYLGFWVTNIVNRDMLMNGYSIGGSYLAELYLVGKGVMQSIGGLFIGFVTVYGVEKWKRNRVGLLMLLFILPSWIYIPRDSTFNFITDNMSNIILFSIISGVMFLAVNNKEKLMEKLEKIKESKHE